MQGVWKNLASIFVDFQQQITYNCWEIFTCYASSANGGKEVGDTQGIWPRSLTILVLEITTTLEEMESGLLSCYQKTEISFIF